MNIEYPFLQCKLKKKILRKALSLVRRFLQKACREVAVYMLFYSRSYSSICNLFFNFTSLTIFQRRILCWSFRTIGPSGMHLSLEVQGEGDKIKFLTGYSGCPHSAAQLISSTAWCYRRFIKRQQITLRPIDFSKARIKHWPRVAIDSLPSSMSARVERHGSRFFTRPRENHEIFTANCWKRIEYRVSLRAAFPFFLLCGQHHRANTVAERVIELQ